MRMLLYLFSFFHFEIVLLGEEVPTHEVEDIGQIISFSPLSFINLLNGLIFRKCLRLKILLWPKLFAKFSKWSFNKTVKRTETENWNRTEIKLKPTYRFRFGFYFRKDRMIFLIFGLKPIRTQKFILKPNRTEPNRCPPLNIWRGH